MNTRDVGRKSLESHASSCEMGCEQSFALNTEVI